MKQFYPDFESIHSLTLSLDYHKNELECTHCLKNDQFISHGVIYKQRSSIIAEKVGKRIFCSNRYGRKGCGRTFQLYIANEFPSRRYNAFHLLVFIHSLLALFSVKKAYYTATGQSDTRHAWRWVNRLETKLSAFRHFLNARSKQKEHSFQSKTRRFQILLPTLNQLLCHFKNNLCSCYQLAQQKTFL